MLVMHFGHRDPEMHSHDATSYYAAIRPASAASHPYAVRHSFHNDFTPGCVACFARPTPGYHGLLDLAFGSPCLVEGLSACAHAKFLKNSGGRDHKNYDGEDLSGEV